MKLEVIISLTNKNTGDSLSVPARFLSSTKKNGVCHCAFLSEERTLVILHGDGGAFLYDLQRPLGDDVSVWKDDSDDEKIKPPKLLGSMAASLYQDATSKCWGMAFDEWTIEADVHDAAATQQFLRSLSGTQVSPSTVPSWARRP